MIPIYPAVWIETEFIGLDIDGSLMILKGYAWDGASGGIDTPAFMRASLVHDALYQLTREGHLQKRTREQVDDLLRAMCIEDGMSRLRAWWVHRGVRIGGGPAADPRNTKAVMIAP